MLAGQGHGGQGAVDVDEDHRRAIRIAGVVAERRGRDFSRSV